MADRILFVDDDPNILAAMRRNLKEQFCIATAGGPNEALALMEKHGPFAVIVSDFKMPVMNGIELLSKTMVRWPDTVRILLTGEADISAGIGAVNQGRVFRFLTKPCLPTPLSLTLKAAIEQHHLIQAERILLEETLRGSFQVLAEVLSFADPAAFSRASRLRLIVKALIEELKVSNGWEFEIAAMLSHIGCITIPEEILQKVCSGEALSADEQTLYASHAETGARLLENIPRLETVVHIIRHQLDPLQPLPSTADLGTVDRKLLGLHLLKTAIEIDGKSAKPSLPATVAEPRPLEVEEGESPRLRRASHLIIGSLRRVGVVPVLFSDLKVGMTLVGGVRDRNGLVLLARGNVISASVLECLRRLREQRGIREPIEVTPESL
jgi:CheY-like chemotaxis protein